MEKSLRIKTPSTTPLKRESKTFLVYNARAIPRRDGTKESAEVSILKLES